MQKNILMLSFFNNSEERMWWKPSPTMQGYNNLNYIM